MSTIFSATPLVMGFQDRIKAATDYEKKLRQGNGANAQGGSFVGSGNGGGSVSLRGSSIVKDAELRGSGAYVGDVWISDWKCAKCSLVRPNWTCFGRDFVCKSCGGSKDDVHLRDLAPEEGQTSAWVTPRKKLSRLDAVLEENQRLREACQPYASTSPFARVGPSPFMPSNPFAPGGSASAPVAPPLGSTKWEKGKGKGKGKGKEGKDGKDGKGPRVVESNGDLQSLQAAYAKVRAQFGVDHVAATHLLGQIDNLRKEQLQSFTPDERIKAAKAALQSQGNRLRSFQNALVEAMDSLSNARIAAETADSRVTEEQARYEQLERELAVVEVSNAPPVGEFPGFSDWVAQNAGLVGRSFLAMDPSPQQKALEEVLRGQFDKAVEEHTKTLEENDKEKVSCADLGDGVDPDSMDVEITDEDIERMGKVVYEGSSHEKPFEDLGVEEKGKFLEIGKQAYMLLKRKQESVGPRGVRRRFCGKSAAVDRVCGDNLATLAPAETKPLSRVPDGAPAALAPTTGNTPAATAGTSSDGSVKKN